MRLHAYLIVRNETALIRRALGSVLEDCDTVTVVDTGSTDGTQALLAELAAGQPKLRWHQGVWGDDFAYARNGALAFATARAERDDWGVVIDADEYFPAGALARLREWCQAAPEEQRTWWVANVNEAVPANRHYNIRCHRLWRGLEWRGRLHECLSHDDRLVAEGVEIIYGHSPAHELDPDRSVRILRAMLADNPRDARALYYLGRDLYYRGEHAEALVRLKARIEIDTNDPERADAHLFAARCAWALGQGDEARRQCLAAILRNPNFKEAIFAMATFVWPKDAPRWIEWAKTATNEGVHFVRVP